MIKAQSRTSDLVRAMIRWLLRQDAAGAFFVLIAAVLLSWFAWTFF